jgi:hypothetical protein
MVVILRCSWLKAHPVNNRLITIHAATPRNPMVCSSLTVSPMLVLQTLVGVMQWVRPRHCRSPRSRAHPSGIKAYNSENAGLHSLESVVLSSTLTYTMLIYRRFARGAQWRARFTGRRPLVYNAFRVSGLGVSLGTAGPAPHRCGS